MTDIDYSRKWWALAAVGSGVLVSTIDGSIVNIALNTLINVFNSNLARVEWVALAYLLTLTCLLLLMGRLGDMFGKRRIYVLGFGVFTVSSAFCGLAPSVEALIGFRVVQAVGAAMIQALGPALLVVAFPAKERGMALGSIGSIVALGILTGPALGGFLLRYVGWESIFYVNIPIGIAGIWLSLRSLPPEPARVGPAPRFDYLGALLLLFSLLGVLLALTEGRNWGWTDPRTLALFAVSLVSSGLFIWWEQHTAEPMVRLTIFRSGAFSLNLLAGFMLFFALAFNLLLTPLFLQLVYRFDLQTVGLILMSLPLTLSLASPISGRLSDRFGSRVLTILGLITVAIGFIGISATRVTTPLPQMIGWLLVLGAGIGMFQSPNNSTVLSNAPPEALGVASGLLAVMRTLGQTGGIAVAGALWTTRVTATLGAPVEPITAAPPQALAIGYGQAMWLAAAVALLAIGPSLAGGRAAARTRPRLAQAQVDQ